MTDGIRQSAILVVFLLIAAALLPISWTYSQTQDVSASGKLTWDDTIKDGSIAKFRGLKMNIDRGAAIVAVPTFKDPARNLEELARGVVVGAFYVPVASQYWTFRIEKPTVYSVRVSRRKNLRWIAEILDGSAVFGTVPAKVETLPFALKEPIALLGVGSHICYLWDSMRACI